MSTVKNNLVSLTWQQFQKQCKEFQKICKEFGDHWNWIEKDPEPGNGYLVSKKMLSIPMKKQIIPDELLEEFEEIQCTIDPATSSQTQQLLINMEYHVIYSISYQIPILFFMGYKNDGTQISLEDSWQIFMANSTNYAIKKPDLLSILTQMDHPILFKPFLALHPCKTSELLGNFPQSENLIMTFISLMGPFVQLKLNPEIGNVFNENNGEGGGKIK